MEWIILIVVLTALGCYVYVAHYPEPPPPREDHVAYSKHVGNIEALINRALDHELPDITPSHRKHIFDEMASIARLLNMPPRGILDPRIDDHDRYYHLVRGAFDDLLTHMFEELRRQLPKPPKHTDGFPLITQTFRIDERGLRAAIDKDLDRFWVLRNTKEFIPKDKPLRETLLFLKWLEPDPVPVPHEVWFEHAWIAAPPGTGKSNLLSHLINYRLDQVAKGQASVIVMESKTDLIKGLRGIKRFEEDLKDRLIIIDADDVEYPIALNIFDIGGSDENLSSRDREAYRNATISMLDYVFRALLGAELTSRQSTLFNFSIQLLMAKGGATLDDMVTLMSPNGLTHFASDLAKTDEDTQSFFKLKFNSREFEKTKEQVVDRIFAVKRIRALSRMFSARKTRFDLYDQMGKGKVILINAPKDLLQEEGVEIFGRFFLAMILLSAQKRASLEQSKRLPVYVFIDEAQDVIRRDDKLPVILDQMRGFRVSMTVAHQRLDQMTPPVLNALYGSTAIKMAARLSDANASALARNMETTADFILKQPQYSFAAYARGVTETAGTFIAPPTDFAKMPRLANPLAIRDEMRKAYAIPPTPKAPPKPEPKPKGRTGDEE